MKLDFYVLLSFILHISLVLSAQSWSEQLKLGQQDPNNFVEVDWVEPVPKPRSQEAKVTTNVQKKAKTVIQTPKTSSALPPKKIETVSTELLKPEASEQPVVSTAQQSIEPTIADQQQEPSPTPQIEVSATKTTANVASPSPSIPQAKEIHNGLNFQQQPGNLKPQYPMVDRLRKHEGEVRLLGYVNNNGRVESPQVLKNTGSAHMAREALLAFQKYRFKLGQTGWIEMPFQFKLSGPTEKLSVRERQYQNLAK